MEFLTDRFETVQTPASWRPRLFRHLRADLAARGAWYCGRFGVGISLRMLVADGALCTILFRLMKALRRLRLGPLAAVIYKLNAFLTGAVIGRGAEFGPGLVILHSVGVVVNQAVRGGSNVVIESGVVVGAEKGRSPILGDRVFLGAGAKVIGGVRIGSGARIGANAVVVKDVPDNATAVGIPARVVNVRGEEA